MGEIPKKYHITDAGDVYRVNDDGSFTSVGNVEKMDVKQPSVASEEEKPTPASTPTADNKSVSKSTRVNDQKWRIIFVIFIVLSLWCLANSAFYYYCVHHPENLSHYLTDFNLQYNVFWICIFTLLIYFTSWWLARKQGVLVKFIQFMQLMIGGIFVCFMCSGVGSFTTLIGIIIWLFWFHSTGITD